jgi:hypothetical protein
LTSVVGSKAAFTLCMTDINRSGGSRQWANCCRNENCLGGNKCGLGPSRTVGYSLRAGGDSGSTSTEDC